MLEFRVRVRVMVTVRVRVTSEKHSHSKCFGLHFILCSTKNVRKSCSGTRFNRLTTFVRMTTIWRETGLLSTVLHRLVFPCSLHISLSLVWPSLRAFLLSLFLRSSPHTRAVRLREKRRISFSFNLSPILNKSKPHFLYGETSSSDDEDNLSKYASFSAPPVGASVSSFSTLC